MLTLLKLPSTCLALLFTSVLFSQQFSPLVDVQANPTETLHGPNNDVHGFLSVNDQLWFYGAFDQVNDVNLACVAFKTQFGFSKPGAFSFPEEVEAITHLLPFQDGAIGIAQILQHQYLIQYTNQNWIILDVKFNYGGVHAMEVINDTVFVGGEFEEINDIFQPFWCEYHPEFGVNWNNSLVNAPIHSMKNSADQLYIGGDFTELEGEPTAYLARLSGSSWFRFPDGLNGAVNSIETHNGQVYLSGDFNAIYGQELDLSGLCKLDSDTFLQVQNQYPNWLDSHVNSIKSAGGKLFLSAELPEVETVVIDGGVWAHFTDFEMSDIKQHNGDFYACLPRGSYTGSFSETSVFKVNFAAQTFSQLKTDAMEYQLSAQGMFLRKKAGFGASPLGLSDDLARAGMIQEAAFCYSGIQNDAIVAAGSGGLDDQEAEDVKWAFGPFADYYHQSFFDQYSRVWKVTRAEIETHIAQIGQPGYVIPEAIFSYPGNGNTNNGESEVLAPFFDSNGNGLYEPWYGEFPEIRGDACITWLLHENDYSSLRAGVQLVQQAYVFTNSDHSMFENTLFLHTEMSNTSTHNIEDLTIGMFSDFDIGSLDANDSFYGCVEEKNCFYAYRDPDPNSSFVNSFDFVEYHPAVANVFLNHELSSFLAVHDETAIYGRPKSAGEVHHLLNSKWGHGASYGIGWCSAFVQYQFMWPSYPWDTSEEARNPFTQGVPNGYRSGIGGCNAENLPAESSICVDQAFISAHALSSQPFSEVGMLMDRVDEVQAWYNTGQLGCMPNEVLVEVEGFSDLQPVVAYPNPCADFLQLDLPAELHNTNYQVFNSLGLEVLTGQMPSNRARLNTSTLTTGTYFLRFSNGEVVAFIRQ